MNQPTAISFAEPERLSKIFDAENREEWQRTSHVLHTLNLRPDMWVADVGAGTGYFSALLADRLPQGRVFALDAEANMVAYMDRRFADEARGNITTGLTQPTDPTLPSGLDLVFLANVYRFIRERALFLANLQRQVTPETQIVFVDFKGAAARVSPAQAKEEVLAAGFVLDSLDLVGCPDHYIMHFHKAAVR